MANSDAPNGLSPVEYLNGAPYNGAVHEYEIAAAEASGNMGVGDLVSLAGSASADGKYPTVTKTAVGGVTIGPIVSVVLETAESPIYRAALTKRRVLVADDPNLIFEVQEDSVGGALAADDIGLNASVILGTFNTDTGLSGTELDTSTANTTNTLDLQILRLVDRPDNALGANAKVLVRLNNHQFVDGVTGV